MNVSQALGPLVGGALIGLSASAFLLLYGRRAGVSGMLASLLPAPRPEPESSKMTDGGSWTAALFVAGLVATGALVRLVSPSAFGVAARPLALVAVSGLLVGFGTRLGSGCTSGHGVCGISRLSKRSLTATLTFMAAGATAVLLARTLGVVS